ncbi:MAG: polyprenol monophosphomannose synthase [Terracidiphilus sp.]
MTAPSPADSLAFLPAPSGSFVIPATSDSAIQLSLILPTFNEAKNIRASLQIAHDVLSAVDNLTFEIIVVDDNSPDGTAQLALNESQRFPELRVMCRTSEAGLATAVIRGWQAARGQILGVMDADLQHPPAVLAQLIQAVQRGSDLAVASRHVENGGVGDWNLFRRIVSRTAQMIGLLILPEVLGRISDPMSGFFMVKRSAIAGRQLNPTGYKILIEVLARGNVRSISEVGYVFLERQEGESKVSLAIYMQYLLHLLRLRIALIRNSRPVRFFFR